MMLYMPIFVDISDNNFQTTWVVCQGVVSTDSTLNGYWYRKEEVEDECLESNGYEKTVNNFMSVMTQLIL